MPEGLTSRLLGASRGQAAVESAIAIPMSMFVILGLIQMAMLQQARMLADYAAYKGARAASVGRAECPLIARAEVAALVPTLGRADGASAWGTVYDKYKDNQRNGQPVVHNEWRIDNVVKPFDKPLQPGDKPEKLHLRMHYFYEMTIPFANWLIARYFLAQRGLQSWANMVDPIEPAATTRPLTTVGASTDDNIANAYFNQHHYVVPIMASWSFRMFSQAKSTSGDCK